MALPALLVFMEPDFGTTLVYGAITVGMLFVHGAPGGTSSGWALAGASSIALVFSILPGAGVQVLQPYQHDRLTSFLHPDHNDLQGNGFHLQPVVIAIGARRRVRQGSWRGATQTRLDYLPEHATDFIFAVVGEERGFVGAAG